jgi:hypothetical protein
VGGWKSHRYCLGCGGRLDRGSSSHCEGCGRAYSRCDSSSYSRSPIAGRLHRLFLGSSAVGDFGLPLLALAVTFIAHATPGRFLYLTIAGIGLWVACAGRWAARFFDRRRAGIRGDLKPALAGRLGLAAAPVLSLACVALLWSGVPVRTGFMVSRRGLEAAADRRPETGAVVRAGAYSVWVEGTEDTGVVRLGVLGDAMGGRRYFVHAEPEVAADPSAAVNQDPRYSRLGEGWYVYAGD